MWDYKGAICVEYIMGNSGCYNQTSLVYNIGYIWWYITSDLKYSGYMKHSGHKVYSQPTKRYAIETISYCTVPGP